MSAQLIPSIGLTRAEADARYNAKIGWLHADNVNRRLGLGVAVPLAKLHVGPPWEEASGGMLLRAEPPTPGFQPLTLTLGEFPNGSGGTVAEPNATGNLGFGLGHGNATVVPGQSCFGVSIERNYGPGVGFMCNEIFLQLTNAANVNHRPLAGVFNRIDASGFWAFSADTFQVRTRAAYELQETWAQFNSGTKRLGFFGGGGIDFGLYNGASLITAPNNFGIAVTLLRYGVEPATAGANTLTIGFSGGAVYSGGNWRIGGGLLLEGQLVNPTGIYFNGEFAMELARKVSVPVTIVTGGTKAPLGNAHLIQCNPPDATLVQPLPTNPADGREVQFVNLSAFNMTIGRNARTINHVAADLVLPAKSKATLLYMANTATWVVTGWLVGDVLGRSSVSESADGFALTFTGGVLTDVQPI